MQCRVTVLTSLLLMLCHVTAWMVSNETGLLAREKRTINGQDLTCPIGCTGCSEYNGCTSCLSNLYLLLVRSGMRQTGECVHACPDGFYGVRRTIYNICNKCHTPHCEACFSKQYCTRCAPPYISYRGQCLWKCPKNLHYANYSKECKEKVDCMVGQWGSWSSCTRDGRTCGYKYGITIRSRKVIEHPSINGERCPSLLENRCCRMAMRHCSGTRSSERSVPPNLDSATNSTVDSNHESASDSALQTNNDLSPDSDVQENEDLSSFALDRHFDIRRNRCNSRSQIQELDPI